MGISYGDKFTGYKFKKIYEQSYKHGQSSLVTSLYPDQLLSPTCLNYLITSDRQNEA